MKKYVEDFSLRGRIDEIDIKLARIYDTLDKNAWDGLYISKVENFAWITAGGDSNITRFKELGVIGILITRKNRYALTDSVEYPRAIDEEELDKLGFEVLSEAWYGRRIEERIQDILGQKNNFGSDIPIQGAEDASGIISEMQYSLTDNEIARYMYLGETFSKAIESVMLEISPGDMEREIVGRINNAIWKHNIDAVLYLVAADERIYKYRHCIPTDKRVRNYMMVSCNGRYKGLITKITRFVHFGEPNAALIKQYKQNLEVENRMIAATKVGGDDLLAFEAALQAYRELGYKDMWKEHHQGGPQGYTNGYYLITSEQHRIVSRNQCYCYNPSITGTKTEDAFIATEEGPLMVTKPMLYPKEDTVINGVSVSRPGLLIL